MFALAGAGWWRLSVALVVSALIAAIAAAGVGFAVWRVSLSFEHGGGEWRGLGAFVMAGFATAATLLIVFVLTVILIGVMKRAIFRRGPASFAALGAGALFFAGGVGAFVLNTPEHALTAMLVRKLGKGAASGADEQELVRRGQTVVPELLAELHRHPYSRSDNFGPGQVPSILRVLGRIGGPEVNAELRKWVEADVDESIRVSALTALAAQGDHGAEAWLVQFLARSDGQWPWYRPQLLKALGQIKATDQIGTIRDVVAQHPTSTPPHVTPEGIAALASIGTDEAWAAIGELSRHKEKSRRFEVVTELQKLPGARSVALLSKALDDPEPSVREAAYWSLLQIEPSLTATAPPPWNEAANEKMREAIRNLEPRTP